VARVLHINEPPTQFALMYLIFRISVQENYSYMTTQSSNPHSGFLLTDLSFYEYLWRYYSSIGRNAQCSYITAQLNRSPATSWTFITAATKITGTQYVIPTTARALSRNLLHGRWKQSLRDRITQFAVHERLRTLT
jgi:hypothetical protein